MIEYPKISVIVPIYNTANLLNRCVSSILNQTYQNLECILVDDGSTDDSCEVCLKLRKSDSRITILRQDNQGQGAARNLALSFASGDYIAFVDSDDFVDAKMYDVLVKNALCYNAEVSACCSNDCNSSNSGTISILEGAEIMKAHILSSPQGANQSPCNKIFAKKLFEKVRFPCTRAYEDTQTIYKLLMKCKTFVFQDTIFYHYERRENSTMTQAFGPVKFAAIDAYAHMYHDYRIHYHRLAHLVKKRLVGSIMYFIGEAACESDAKAYEAQCKRAFQILNEIGLNDIGIKQFVLCKLLLNQTILFKLLYRKFKRHEK